MANYDKDDEKYRDPYSSTAPVEPTPVVRDTDPTPLGRGPYPDEPGGPRGSRPGMAVIPVLLLALVIAGAWWLMRTTPEPGMRDAVGTTGYETGVPPGTTGFPAGTTGTAENLAALRAGDDVHLHDVQITEVTGERTFWIGAGTERTLVVAPPTVGVTGQIGDRREGFRRGQTVAIEGRAEAVDGFVVDGLSPSDHDALRRAEGIIIRANRVTGL